LLQSTTKILSLSQLLILLVLFYSFDSFINIEIAVISALLVTLASMHSYHSLVQRKLHDKEGVSEDLFEKIDDPYDLYGEDIDEKKELRDVIKEQKIALKKERKTIKNVALSSPAIFSPWRIGSYAMLVFGFLALQNNSLLYLPLYLPSLAVGVILGYSVGRVIFLKEYS